VKVGSTFSGVGGLDLGLEKAGMNVIWQAEIDEWCRQVLANHWPETKIYEDVRDIDESAEKPDILVGGFPCQDLSLAGRRAGLAGEKSGLFFEFARICGELRPQWFLLENVGGLLSSSDGRDFGIVLAEMAALGYGISWRLLDARFFGVPQRRRRVFIVGCLGADGCKRAVRALGAGREGDLEAGQCSWQSNSAGTQRSSRTGSKPEVAKCLTTRNQRLDPDYETFVVKSISENQRAEVRESDTAQILASGGKVGQGYPAVKITKPVVQSLTTRFGTTGADLPDVEAGWVQEMPVLRRLTPLECERLMSWPDNWTLLDEKTPDNKRYAACGNGVVSNVSEWICRRIMAVENE